MSAVRRFDRSRRRRSVAKNDPALAFADDDATPGVDARHVRRLFVRAPGSGRNQCAFSGLCQARGRGVVSRRRLPTILKCRKRSTTSATTKAAAAIGSPKKIFDPEKQSAHDSEPTAS